MSEQAQPFDDDALDEDLLTEEDVTPPSSSPGKKKGGKKKAPSAPQPPARRPFVESQIKQRAAKTDISEMMGAWDWDSGEYEVSVKRVQPQTWQGRNIQGYIAKFPHAVDEEFLKENFGGGIFDLTVRGPSPKTNSIGFLDHCRVKVSGDPIVSAIDKNFITDGGGLVLADPQGGPPSMRQFQAAMGGDDTLRLSLAERGDVRRNPRLDGDSSLVRMSFDQVSRRADEAAKEASKLRERLIETTMRRPRDEATNEKTLRFIKESQDQVIQAERRAADAEREALRRQREEDKERRDREIMQEQGQRRDFERLIGRLAEQKGGVPPEMLASLTEQHRSELNASNDSWRAQLSQERQRYESEIRTVRERYESELNMLREKGSSDLLQVRGELQSRLDREVESRQNEVDRLRNEHRTEVDRLTAQHSTEVERLRSEHKNELDRVREAWNKRFEDIGKEHARQLQTERDQHRQMTENAQQRAQADREALVSQHNMQLENARKLHETQISQLNGQLSTQHSTAESQRTMMIEQIRGQYESQLSTLKAQHEAMVQQLSTQASASAQLTKATLEAQITQLQSELERTRGDLHVAQTKVSDQGDLAAQAAKLKDIGNTLGAVFNLGGAAGAVAGPVESEVEDDTPRGWLGTLMKLADSRLGEGIFGFIQQAAMSASGAYPPGGGYYGPPPAGLPGNVAYPQPNPGGAPGYPQPGYPPQPPYPSPPSQPYPAQGAEVVDDEYYDEEEEEEYEEVEEVQPPPAPARAPQPRAPENLTSDVGSDGVVRGQVPPVPQPAPPPPAPDIAEASPEPYEPPQQRPVTRPSGERVIKPKPVKRPAAPKSPPQQMQLTPEQEEAMRQQAMAMIQMVEQAMKENATPEQLAAGIAKMVPAQQIQAFAEADTAILIQQVQELAPGSLLASYNGKKYLKQLQGALAAYLQPQR